MCRGRAKAGHKTRPALGRGRRNQAPLEAAAWAAAWDVARKGTWDADAAWVAAWATAWEAARDASRAAALKAGGLLLGPSAEANQNARLETMLMELKP